MTRYTITRNLQAGPVQVIGGLVESGFVAQLSAPVLNVGDRGVNAPRVSIFAREVEPGGRRGSEIVVAENVLVEADVLRGHFESRVTVEWEPPYSANWEFWAVADPQNNIVESNENDNEGPMIITNDISQDLRGDLLRIITGKLAPSDELKEDADLNLDGVLDVSDYY
jgi:hypothetical protein